jgi:hypothetical protein
MHQDTDAHDCLESVPFTVRHLGVMERLLRPELSGLPQDSYNEDSLTLVRDFEETVVKLYTTRGNRREIGKLVSELPQSVIDAYDSILNNSRDKRLARELPYSPLKCL